MDFVSDYVTKKKLAEQLRGRQQGLIGQKIDYSPIVTQGQGAAPTQVQANWGAPIQALGNAYFANRAGENASAQEAQAQEARMQALQGMMTKTEGGNKLDVSDIMGLSQLDMPAQVLKKLVPDDPALGAVTQAYENHQGIDALVKMKAITAEEGAQAHKDLDARTAAAKAAAIADYEQKKQIDARYEYHAPTQGRQPTEMEMYLKASPEERALMEQYRGIGKGGKGGGKGKGDPAAEAAAMTLQLDEADRLVNDPKNASMFGPGQRFVAAANNYMDANPGELKNIPGRMFISPQENPAAAALRRLGTEQSFSRVKELYPASNTDIALARSLSANIFQSKEAANAYIRQMRLMQQKYPLAFQPAQREVRGGPGQSDGEGVGANAGNGDWSVEED